MTPGAGFSDQYHLMSVLHGLVHATVVDTLGAITGAPPPGNLQPGTDYKALVPGPRFDQLGAGNVAAQNLIQFSTALVGQLVAAGGPAQNHVVNLVGHDASASIALRVAVLLQDFQDDAADLKITCNLILLDPLATEAVEFVPVIPPNVRRCVAVVMEEGRLALRPIRAHPAPPANRFITQMEIFRLPGDTSTCVELNPMTGQSRSIPTVAGPLNLQGVWPIGGSTLWVCALELSFFGASFTPNLSVAQFRETASKLLFSSLSAINRLHPVLFPETGSQPDGSGRKFGSRGPTVFTFVIGESFAIPTAGAGRSINQATSLEPGQGTQKRVYALPSFRFDKLNPLTPNRWLGSGLFVNEQHFGLFLRDFAVGPLAGLVAALAIGNFAIQNGRLRITVADPAPATAALPALPGFPELDFLAGRIDVN